MKFLIIHHCQFFKQYISFLHASSFVSPWDDDVLKVFSFCLFDLMTLVI